MPSSYFCFINTELLYKTIILAQQIKILDAFCAYKINRDFLTKVFLSQ